MITKEFDALKLLQIENCHVDECGLPPNIDAKEKYISYFENSHGEQWVFIGDEQNKKASIYGGDINWEKPIEISNERICPNMVLDDLEKNWIVLCWAAMMKLSFFDVEKIYHQHATELAKEIAEELKNKN